MESESIRVRQGPDSPWPGGPDGAKKGSMCCVGISVRCFLGAGWQGEKGGASKVKAGIKYSGQCPRGIQAPTTLLSIRDDSGARMKWGIEGSKGEGPMASLSIHPYQS